ncbi:MAG TPA: phosphatidylglycerol lysyltransferase domain-containing protein [Candidatus Methylacidiphilales bacterium]|nr:phosphatidylglycerol lysyltransferase domain-containing protein [Candidatus Methylacidiphilales bacterium]
MNTTALSPWASLRQSAKIDALQRILPVVENKIPLGQPTSVVVLAWAVRLSAVVNFVSALLRHEPKLIYRLGHWVPFQISEGQRFLMLLTSVMLFSLASGLVRGKRVAWLLTIGALLIAPILHLGRAAVWPQGLVSLTLIGFLFSQHRYFTARSDQRSVHSAVIIWTTITLTLLVFGMVRLHALHKEITGDHSWPGCLQAAAELVLVQNTHTETALTSHAKHLFSVLRVGGAAASVLGLALILRPVLLRRRASPEQREKLRPLIRLYGQDPLHAFALLDDKSYFFAFDGRAAVPYALSSSFAVALADPVCHPALQPQAIAEFVRFCRKQDWEPVFYEVNGNLLHAYEAAGLSIFKIGEEARLRAATFQLRGRSFQNLRTICNRARRLGVSFRWYTAADGIDEALERQLEAISHSWLEGKRTREMTFDMGSYSLEEIRRHGAGVALDVSGRALAFATWRPFARGKGRTLDLMRAGPQAGNIIDFVLVESIAHFRRTGIDDISLGMAPLANAKPSSLPLVAEEKLVQFLFRNLDHIYGYKSLFEFKRKYRPEWKERYVAYRRGVHLPLVGLALVRVHAPEGFWKFLLG